MQKNMEYKYKFFTFSSKLNELLKEIENTMRSTMI